MLSNLPFFKSLETIIEKQSRNKAPSWLNLFDHRRIIAIIKIYSILSCAHIAFGIFYEPYGYVVMLDGLHLNQCGIAFESTWVCHIGRLYCTVAVEAKCCENDCRKTSVRKNATKKMDTLIVFIISLNQTLIFTTNFAFASIFKTQLQYIIIPISFKIVAVTLAPKTSIFKTPFQRINVPIFSSEIGSH
jgi:hypothetical protein